MPGSVEDLWVRLGANISGYVSGMEAAGAASGRFDLAQLRAQEHARAGWASAGVGLAAFGVAIGVAAVGVAAFSIKSAMAFQTQMERLHTLGGATQQEVDRSTGAVLSLATQTGFSGTKIAEALYHPISVGYSLKDSLVVARYAAEESKISGASLDDTMYSLTSTMKALNLPTSSAGQTMGMLHAIVSQVVWRLVAQLADLSPDVTAIVLGELTCQIRSYRWRKRHCGLVTSLELDTRRAVLSELRPSDRYHPERVEQLTADGVVCLADRLTLAGRDEEDLDVVDLLLWAAGCGVDVGDLRLLVASERARGRRGACGDARVAAARGISRRHLLRRRKRALIALRAVAPAYLQAVS